MIENVHSTYMNTFIAKLFVPTEQTSTIHIRGFISPIKVRKLVIKLGKTHSKHRQGALGI
ncbi:hypothetical protein BTJ40_06295 [Microbulbifer sp. A4B17]|nr:hypothetical protein BTJ40_06295 [Microbulbifer sp. A4B17]